MKTFCTADEIVLNAACFGCLDFTEPITAHSHILSSHDLWNDTLDLIDVESGRTLPALNCGHVDRSRADSWSLSRERGLSRRHDPEEEGHMKTLEPGRWHQIFTPSGGSDMSFHAKHWLLARMSAGVFESGKRYALRLRDDDLNPRWTYGRVEERTGPYDLPPLPVEMEKEVQFDSEWHGGALQSSKR